MPSTSPTANLIALVIVASCGYISLANLSRHQEVGKSKTYGGAGQRRKHGYIADLHVLEPHALGHYVPGEKPPNAERPVNRAASMPVADENVKNEDRRARRHQTQIYPRRDQIQDVQEIVSVASLPLQRVWVRQLLSRSARSRRTSGRNTMEPQAPLYRHKSRASWNFVVSVEYRPHARGRDRAGVTAHGEVPRRQPVRGSAQNCEAVAAGLLQPCASLQKLGIFTAPFHTMSAGR